jgi:CMP-N,N'-diacetyllegionaminic acid synthase
MMRDEVLALIPARGNSKSIPRKNLLVIAGKPLIAYTILQAKAARTITRVIVSTDDEEIAAVARQWGAEVPFLRPDEFAQDLSPDIDAFRHALQWLDANERYRPEVVVHLRPTCPMRRVELIDHAISRLLECSDADALRSVTQAMLSPYKMWRMGGDGYLEPFCRIEGIPDCQSLPRQMLPQVFWQNGYVDVIRPRAVLEKHSMWGTRVIPLIIEDTVFELDYVENIPDIENAILRAEAGLPVEQHPSQGRHSI